MMMMKKDLVVVKGQNSKVAKKKIEQKKASKSKMAGQEKQKGKFVASTGTTHLCCGITYLHWQWHFLLYLIQKASWPWDSTPMHHSRSLHHLLHRCNIFMYLCHHLYHHCHPLLPSDHCLTQAYHPLHLCNLCKTTISSSCALKQS